MRDQLAAISSHFDAAAPEYALSREGQHSFVCQREIVLSLLPMGCARILDAGCGPALMADRLLRHADEVWGLDAAARMIVLGTERMRHHPHSARLHLRTGAIERLPFSDGSFDAVVAMGVLEYVLEREQALAEIRRVLRPGGIAVITVPNRVSAYYVAQSAWVLARRLAKRAMGRPSRPEPFVMRRCIPWRFDRELEAAGLHKQDERYCRRASILLGTQYIVRAVRR